MRFLHVSLGLAAVLVASASEASADIVWVGGVSADLFDEANWDLSGSTVTVVDPDVTIDDNVVIVDAPAPIDLAVPVSQSRFQVGDGYVITVGNSTVFTSGNDGFGGAPGTTNGPTLEVVNGGDVATYFITNDVQMNLDATSSAHLGGPATPINGSKVDLVYGALLACTNETPADFVAEHLSKITVAGVPAVLDFNLSVVSDGGAGCLVEVIPPAVGTGYCFGDGSGGTCPCGNTGAGGHGCGNGTFAAGARLDATGTLDAVTLRASEVAPGQPTLFFQGLNATNGGDGILFGDGLRCAGGSVVRLGVETADAAGAAVLAGTVQESGGGAAPGETRRYQAWYRDPALSPCGGGFNLSNGVEIAY